MALIAAMSRMRAIADQVEAENLFSLFQDNQTVAPDQGPL
jgi:hypothetical protein